MQKTYEQLQAEAKAAQEALAKAEEEQRAKERAAKEEEKKRERASAVAKAREKWKAVGEALVAVLVVKGFDASYTFADNDYDVVPLIRFGDKEHNKLGFGELYIGFVERRRSLGRFSSAHAGWALRVGWGSDRKDYPQKPDGGFSYSKAAEELRERVQRMKAAQVREQNDKNKEQVAQGLAAAVRVRLGLAKDSDVISGAYTHSFARARGFEYRTYVAEEGKVYLNIGRWQVTPDQASIVVEALRKAGLLKEGK